MANVAIINDAGDILQLTPGQNLVTELNVAWLSDDELPGEFSYPIDVPLNEANKRFVSHSYRPDLAEPRTEIAITVKMEGVLYRRCMFTYRINSGKLSGFLKIDSAQFYDSIRKLTLLEALSTPIPLGDGLAGTPPIGIQGRLKQIAAMPVGTFPFTFFPIRNETMMETGFDESKLAGFVRNTYVNAWEPQAGGGFGFGVDLPNMPKFGYLLCPQFFLSYVLTQIMKLAGYRIESDWLNSADVQAITITNLTAMSQHQANLGDFISGHQLIPGLFLPDMSVSDFLKAVKGRFGLVFTYNANSRICHITQFVQTVAAGPSIDLTAFQSGDYSTDYRDGSGYTVHDFIDSSDELYRDSNGTTITAPGLVIGKGQTDVTLRAGTSQLIRELSPMGTNAYWFVPTLRQPGNVLDPNYKQSDRYPGTDGKRKTSIGLKLLSFRGMTLDSMNNPYPLASPDVYDGHQVAVSTQALKLPGRNGSWRNGLRSYYYFRDQTQKIAQPLLLPVDVLSSLQLFRTVSLSLNDFIRRSYLISKIQADSPGPDGKVPVRLEVLTLPTGIEQGADLDEPRVWVEFIIGPSVRLDRPYIYETVAFVAKFWADANKTTPAIVTNLPLNIRFKKALYSTAQDAPLNYWEYTQTYFANGRSTIVDPAFLANYPDTTTPHTQYYSIGNTLDPGEGYAILSSTYISR